MELTVNLKKLSESERESLMALAKKSTKPKSKVWKPEIGEWYYCILPSAEICNKKRKCDDMAEILLKLGICFKTKEEAKFALERRLIEVELQRFAEEHNNECEIDWTNFLEYKRYSLVYDYIANKVYVTTEFYYVKEHVIYFDTKEIAQSAIEEIGEERLIKYYFDIKE